MSPRVRTALVSVVGFVAAFAVVLLGGRYVGRDGGPETDALTVGDALAQPSQTRVAVRGFLFFDESTGVLLCSARTATDPPACEGTVMRVERLDPNRIDLVRPEVTEGAYDAYSRDEIALVGTKLGAVLEVEDVLR